MPQENTTSPARPNRTNPSEESGNTNRLASPRLFLSLNMLTAVFAGSAAWELGLLLPLAGPSDRILLFLGSALAGAAIGGALYGLSIIFNGRTRSLAAAAFHLAVISTAGGMLFLAAGPLLAFDDGGAAWKALARAFVLAGLFALAAAMALGVENRRGRGAAVLAALVAFSGWLGATERKAAGGVRVVLVTIDTMRADRAGYVNPEARLTPFLDSLASSGVAFDRAYCTAPVTDPSHASILTGMYPRTLGMIYNGYPAAKKNVASLAAELRKRGFATAAVTSRVHLDPRVMGIPGFDFASSPSSKALDTPASQATRRASIWLRNNRHGNLFLWVHYWDPHAPYNPPEYELIRELNPSAPAAGSPNPAPVWVEGDMDPEFIQWQKSAYDMEVLYTDLYLGKLHDFAASLWENPGKTLWIVTADHGEVLGELWPELPYGFGHAEFVYEQSVRAPWIMAGGPVPKSENGKATIMGPPVSLIDLAPTVLDLLGLDVPAKMEGRSLAGAVRGQEELPADRSVFIERWLPHGGPHPSAKGPMRAVAADEWKLVLSEPDGKELYRLPGGRAGGPDMHSENPEAAASLRRSWTEWEQAHPLTPPKRDAVMPVTVNDFRALGYFQ